MNVIEEARGRWVGLMDHFGLKLRLKKHGPCPICGGKDRFIFDDKEGLGTFHCNHCGAGTGFTLLTKVKGWDMRRAMREVKQIVGKVEKRMETKKEITDTERRKGLNETWSAARPVSLGDPVQKYLYARTGLVDAPSVLRFHPALFHSDTRLEHPAMIAKVTDPDNKPVSIHRTYLTTGGDKANVEKARMLMQGSIPDGSAIRLFPYQDTLGIAEGIETAISVYAIFGIPTWASISAAMMVKWSPPAPVRKVYIFSDNDKGFAGQAAAYRLGYQLANSNAKYEIVKVVVPDITGADWNDVLTLHGSEAARALVTGKIE